MKLFITITLSILLAAAIVGGYLDYWWEARQAKEQHDAYMQKLDQQYHQTLLDLRDVQRRERAQESERHLKKLYDAAHKTQK